MCHHFLFTHLLTSLKPFVSAMFSSLGLFKQVECPEQARCSLTNCIFAHHSILKNVKAESLQEQPTSRKASAREDIELDRSDEPRKKRRISGPDSEDAISTVEPNLDNAKILAPATVKLGATANEGSSRREPFTGRLSSTAFRAISPPPLRNPKERAANSTPTQYESDVKKELAAYAKPNIRVCPVEQVVEESLNPRMLPNPPASHAIRLKLITMLHEHMVRLNDEVRNSQDPSITPLMLSRQGLIQEILNEEEKIAKQNPAIYTNIVKMRIVALKRMKLADWHKERLDKTAKEVSVHVQVDAPKPPKIIETGLSTSEEIAFLPRLVAQREAHLVKHGYVFTAPGQDEVEQARKGVEAAQGWEQCDRCQSRFQVFPGRREEDGALTSGGMCSYHPGKSRRQLGKGTKETLYTCCNESIGTSMGCTSADTHVFKISETKRLALVMPFKETPGNDGIEAKNAVCFDCEMGYTTLGLELIRLTATSWPDGKEGLDVLVRPLGEILDLNSQFSGVWPEDFAKAAPYKAVSRDEDIMHPRQGDTDQHHLLQVESPSIARDLLFNLLKPETPLIGQALENDLNATRIIHPSIIDTCLLYPHPRGLPIRFGLKSLMKKHLDRDIQMAGSQGHDSKEDARAAGDLVRLKVAESWKMMKRDGWTVKDGEFNPPLPPLDAKAGRLKSAQV